MFNRKNTNLDFRHLCSIDRNVSIHRWVFDVCDGEFTVVGLVGIPSRVNGPFPLIVAFHGTAGSPEKVFGLDGKDEYHHKFALRLVEQGYMVFSPLIITEVVPE